MTSLPVLAGFGISSAEMVAQLEGRVDGVVIGSHIINLFNSEGIEAVGEFIRNCRSRGAGSLFTQSGEFPAL